MKTEVDNQLFFYVFGIGQDASTERKEEVCADKAYRDMCRTLKYKKTENDNDNEDSMKKRDRFRKDVCKCIINGIKSYPEIEKKESTFDDWHNKLTLRIIDYANNDYGDLLLSQGSEGVISSGQVQKWINMTVKYMRIMEILPESMLTDIDYIHIPVDSFVLLASLKNSKWLPDDYSGLKKLNVDMEIKSWSKMEYSEYSKYQKEIRKETQKIGMKPMEWEEKAWLAVASAKALE